MKKPKKKHQISSWALFGLGIESSELGGASRFKDEGAMQLTYHVLVDLQLMRIRHKNSLTDIVCMCVVMTHIYAHAHLVFVPGLYALCVCACVCARACVCALYFGISIKFVSMRLCVCCVCMCMCEYV